MVVTTFVHKGETWRKFPVTPKRAFAVGVDLGKSVDSTCVAIVEYGLIGSNNWIEKRGNSNVLVEKYQEHFDLRELERIPLGTPYPEVVAYCESLMAREPLRSDGTLVIDDTGAGRPVGDFFENQTNLRPIRITTTAGELVSYEGRNRWHVPKAILVATVDGLLSSGELRVAKSLPTAEALREELKNFRRSLSAAGRATFSAAAGKHDDTISALSLACWYASHQHSPGSRTRRGEVSTGVVRGMI
jgi:hypothetical protein